MHHASDNHACGSTVSWPLGMPEHYNDFFWQMQQADFEVSWYLLSACDEARRLRTDVLADLQVVRKTVNSLLKKTREILISLPSYMGAVEAEAMKELSKSECATKGLPTGFLHIIYMCGFMLQAGESICGASFLRSVSDPVEGHEVIGITFLRET